MKKFTFLFLIFFLPLFTLAQDQVKIAAYNLLNYPNGSNDTRNGYFKTVVDSMQPDVLVVEEITSQSGVDQFLSQVLDTTFSAGTFINGPDTDCEIFFKDSLFEFVSNTPISTDLRNINQFIIFHKPTQDTLRLYALHLKASQGSDNEQRRLAEVNKLRDVTDALPQGTDYVVLGDFNIYYSYEPAFLRLLDTTSTGYFIDPIDAFGYWHNNSSFAAIHSQSTRVNEIGGGSGGGLDDRFDMILVSPSILQEGKIDYVDNTLKPYGNDGQHFNGNINDPPFTIISQVVANALYYASDHLPVMADFIFNPPVNVNDGQNVVFNYKLEQNFPNPFNPVTTIRFELPESEMVELKVYDMLGREVETLYNKVAPAGIVEVDFNAEYLASGLYIYRIKAGDFVAVKKLMLLK
jgi:hypothetical protein